MEAVFVRGTPWDLEGAVDGVVDENRRRRGHLPRLGGSSGWRRHGKLRGTTLGCGPPITHGAPTGKATTGVGELEAGFWREGRADGR